MSRRHRPLIGTVVLVAIGCSEAIPPPPPAASTSQVSPLLAAETIAPGDRPSEVQGAKLYSVPEFLAACDAEQLAKGDTVCVEGTVIRSGTVFGAPFVHLSSDPMAKQVHCEGDALARFQFEQGANVIIRGRIGISQVLGDSNLVTQDAISRAIADERHSD